MSTTPATPGPYSGTSLPAASPAARPPGLAEGFTDAQLQAAIDAAFPIEARFTGDWPDEAPNRLAIARAFLASLPERPQAQPGPWPGQQEAIDAAMIEAGKNVSYSQFLGSNEIFPNEWSEEAPARLAIAQAYDKARPQAAEIAELKGQLEDFRSVLKAVEPWERKAQEYLDAGRWAGRTYAEGIMTELEERDSELAALKDSLFQAQEAAKDLLDQRDKAKAELGESQRKLSYAEEHLGILAKTFGYEGRTWCNMVSYLAPRLEKAERDLAKAEAELAALRQSYEPANIVGQLQQLACEEGNAEAVKEIRKYASSLSLEGVNSLLKGILECLPPILAAKAAKAVVAAARPAIEAEAQPWTPAVGDVVRLKSGGPVMTVYDIAKDKSFICCVHNTKGLCDYTTLPAACLTPAKEGQP